MAAREEGEVSFKAFARILGERSPSYVTQLKAEGRLILSADGKRVRVAESLALVRSTADPGKAGVVARHAAARDGVADAVRPDPASEPDVDAGGEPGGASADPIEQSHARRRSKAMADKAETDALAADRDYRKSMGELLEAAEVEHAVRVVGAYFRGSLENLPNTLAPELSAMTDEGRIRVLLSEAFEYALEELSRQFAALGRREEAA
jgi:hypothetical protein